MGTAASASVSEAVQGKSVEEIQRTFQELSEADRTKVQNALAAVGGEQQQGPANAGNRRRSWTQEEAASAAPFLAEYFKKAEERMTQAISDVTKLVQIAEDPEAAKQFQEEIIAWYETEAKPLLLKSFAHHDTKNTNVLDEEEAAAFFMNLVQLSKRMSALIAVETEMRRSVETLKAFEPSQREALFLKVTERNKKSIEEAMAAMEAKEERYFADKDRYDAAAFKCLDAAGDGVIRLEEFLAAFEPYNEKSTEIHMALGFLTEEEIDTERSAEYLLDLSKALSRASSNKSRQAAESLVAESPAAEPPAAESPAAESPAAEPPAAE